jgi:hypothetical protein
MLKFKRLLIIFLSQTNPILIILQKKQQNLQLILSSYTNDPELLIYNKDGKGQ